jgi:DNA-binding beta-propeller fold protein YncE
MQTMHQCLVILCLVTLASGCDLGGGSTGQVDKIWGERGVADGRFQKPRAITIDKEDRLYIVDMTARIQVFDTDGNFLRSWRTPAWQNGRPTGLSFDNAGNLMVPDTHYFRVLFYTPEGKLLEDRTIGGQSGTGPGQFGFVTDVVQDSRGNYYVSEYGEFDRIQKFSPDGNFLFQWGGHGPEPGKFKRPQSLALDEHDHLWVADACNHRIQIFDATGSEAKIVKIWGVEGAEPGQMRYPYGILLDGQGHVIVTEFGNQRVQKFTLDGQSLACFGGPGREPGRMHQPWASVLDSQGRLHVLDSYNHRVQRVKM